MSKTGLIVEGGGMKFYPVRYKELDFTVPEFSGFIQRLSEYQQCE